MATRFYLPRWDGRAAPATVPFGGQWERTTNAFRLLAATTKGATAPLSTTGGQFTKDGATAGYDVLQAQFVSEPLAAQTISGSFSAVVRAGESATAADATLQVVIRVVSGDGVTQRGVLYGGHAAALNATVGAIGQEMATAAQTRIFPAGTALTSVAAEAGDRLVIEVGARHHGTNTAVNSFIQLGDAAATADHTLAAGATTSLCPWVELSATLAFTPTASTIALTPATLSLSAASVTAAPQPVTVQVAPAALTMSAAPVGAAPPPVTVTLTPAALALSAVAPTAFSAAAPMTVTLTPAALALTPVALTPSPRPVNRTLTPAALRLAGAPVGLTPLAVTVTLAPAALTLAATPVQSSSRWTVTLTPADLRLDAAPVALVFFAAPHAISADQHPHRVLAQAAEARVSGSVPAAGVTAAATQATVRRSA